MAKLAGEAVQVRIKGVDASRMFDQRLVTLLEREFPEIRYGPIHFYLPRAGSSERLESILVGYVDSDHEKKRIFTVDCDEPKTLERMLTVFERFLETKHA